jgi:hypothetical protein
MPATHADTLRAQIELRGRERGQWWATPSGGATKRDDRGRCIQTFTAQQMARAGFAFATLPRSRECW